MDWISLGRFMGRLSASKRSKVVKLEHNWQNRGRQKGIFLRSMGENEEADIKEQCPMGYGCYKDSLHYLVCPNILKKGEMARGLTGIKKWMKTNDTDPGLSAVLMRILKNYLDGKITRLSVWNFNNEINKSDLEDLV